MNNDLNSLFLEGVVSGKPLLNETSTTSVLNFTVETNHYYKNGAGEDVTETSHFKVVAFGSMCDIPVKEGSGVRIVGRLKQNNGLTLKVHHTQKFRLWQITLKSKRLCD